jgi:hypothetical protein
MDCHARNLNEAFKTNENVYQIFYILDLAIAKCKIFQKDKYTKLKN